MKPILFTTMALLLLAGCDNSSNTHIMQPAQQDSAIGKIEWYDSSVTGIIDTNAGIT